MQPIDRPRFFTGVQNDIREFCDCDTVPERSELIRSVFGAWRAAFAVQVGAAATVPAREVSSCSAARLPAPTLTAPAAIASVATTTSSIVTRSGPPFLWARLVHGEASSIELRSVQSADCALRFRTGVHFDKTETLRAAGEFIDDYPGRIHGAVLGEELLQLFVGGCIGQAANVDPIRHILSSFIDCQNNF
jgi:hypothetical protein